MEKKIIIFDMDNTINPPKAPIDQEMAKLLKSLLEIKQVCIISGGWFPQFKTQVINNLNLFRLKKDNQLQSSSQIQIRE